MNIVIIGTGYVGLVTAAVLAKLGHQVWGLDVDEQKVSSLQKSEIPFFEPDLEKLVLQGLKKGNLQFTTSYTQAISQAQAIFICVGTPAQKDGDYDLSYIFETAAAIGKSLKNYAVICIKSTVPPGTADQVRKIIKKQTQVKFDLASCPEFLKEGSAVADSFKPSRVVIGVETAKAKKVLLKLHQKISGPRLICDINSAQMVKYAANALLATKISFINSIARICDKVGANIETVTKGLSLDPRISGQFLQAGLGYGGSCFPKDTWALISLAQRLGYDFKFLKEVDRVNQDQVGYLVQQIVDICDGSIKGKVLTVLGLSFKPETDDMREARAVPLIEQLQQKGAKIQACDPVALENAAKILKNVKLLQNPYLALKNSSALILVTEWDEFKNLNFKKASQVMAKKVIIDGRNIYNPEKLKKLGFKYRGVGRQ